MKPIAAAGLFAGCYLLGAVPVVLDSLRVMEALPRVDPATQNFVLCGFIVWGVMMLTDYLGWNDDTPRDQ